jgi:hypothetical protein
MNKSQLNSYCERKDSGVTMNECILLVEDEEGLRMTLSDRLHSEVHGYSTVLPFAVRVSLAFVHALLENCIRAVRLLICTASRRVVTIPNFCQRVRTRLTVDRVVPVN